MTESQANKVAVLGAGNSGQAVAGFLSLSGYQVALWNRPDQAETERWLKPIQETGSLEVYGVIEGNAVIHEVTTDLGAAIEGADAIIVNTTTDAYQNLGRRLSENITEEQTLILMAGGTLGSLDMWQGLIAGGFSGDLLVGETSTTIFGSRATGPATVRVTGRKESVEIASLPAGELKRFNSLIPEFRFTAADDILISGFNNTGPAIHVVPMVLNAGWIEAQGGEFLYFREGITPSVASIIEQFDAERLSVAQAYDYTATSTYDYLVNSVGAPEGTLYESITGCALYAKTPSPTTLDHRFVWEDTMAGIVPLIALAENAGVKTPVANALATLAGSLLQRDFHESGRTARSLGIDDLGTDGIKALVQNNTVFREWKEQRAGLLGVV